MKQLLCMLLPVLCYACGNSNRIFDINTKFCPEARETIELTGEKLPIVALGGYGLDVFDTLLVVTTNSPSHFRDVYGLKSCSLLAEILKKGRAQNEFLFAGYEGQYVLENGCLNLYIHDLNKSVFWKYNLTESVKQHADCGEIVCKLPGGYQGAYYLSRGIFCYRDTWSDRGPSYVIKNMEEDKVIDEFSILDCVESGDERYISIGNNITKDHRVVVCDFWKIDLLMFINLMDKTKICVSTSDEQSTWTRLKAEYEDKSKIYYCSVATTEREIYALYKGNPEHLEIHCFSQTGDFLRRMIVKEKIISFDISGSFMYGLTTDEEIYKYKL